MKDMQFCLLAVRMAMQPHIRSTCIIILISFLVLGEVSCHAARLTTKADHTIISGVEFGYMDTFSKAPESTVYHMEYDLFVKNSILFSDGSGLKTTTNGSAAELIVGAASNSGYKEGVGDSARFSSITGFAQINSTHVLISDFGNHCIRLLNRETKETSPFAGKCGDYGFQDGLDSRFDNPYSIIRNPANLNQFAITDSDNNAIRLLDLDTSVVTTLLKTGYGHPHGLFYAKNENALYFTQHHSIGRVDLKTRATVNITGSGLYGKLDGKLDTATFSTPWDIILLNKDIILVADYGNNLLRIVDKRQKWVRSVCTGSGVSIDDHLIRCGLDDPKSLLHHDGVLYIGTDNRIRNITLKNFSVVDSCPEDVTAEISADMEMAEVEIIPGQILKFPPGYYRYSIPEQDCNVNIRITKELKCPQAATLVADSSSSTGSLVFTRDGSWHQVDLPAGSYPYHIFSDEKNCSLQLNIVDSKLKRRLDFKAEYDIKCSVYAASGTVEMLKALANLRYQQIEEICSGKCQRSAVDTVTTSCSNDVVSITWPTNMLFPGSEKMIPNDIRTFIEDELKQRKFILDMVIYTRIPPIVYPRLQADGLPSYITVTSICSNGGIYDKSSDSCSI